MGVRCCGDHLQSDQSLPALFGRLGIERLQVGASVLRQCPLVQVGGLGLCRTVARRSPGQSLTPLGVQMNCR